MIDLHKRFSRYGATNSRYGYNKHSIVNITHTAH